MNKNLTVGAVGLRYLSSRALLAVSLMAIFLSGGPVIAAEARSGESPVPQEDCGVPVRIMPLGDSITKGSSSGVTEEGEMISYRKDLWEGLQAAGYNVNFVGSLTNGDSYSGFDPNHEGHGGRPADWIRDNIYGSGLKFLDNNPADIILLHIGTNDINSGQTPADVAGEVDQLLENIDTFEASAAGNHVKVLLARIIHRVGDNTAWIDYNNALQAMADARIAAGDDLIVVDQEYGAGLVYLVQPAGDMYDNGNNKLHPFHTGYTKMAAEWKKSLDPLLEVCNHPPIIDPEPVSRADTELDPVNLQIIASDPDSGQSLTYTATNLPPGLSIAQNSGVISGTVACNAAASSPYQVTVKATDNGTPQLSDSASFTWTINNANCRPVLTNPGDQTSVEGMSPPLQLVASDPDPGDSLTYETAGLPPGLGIDEDTGLISGTLTFEAAADSPYTVTVTATDPGTLSDSETFEWVVNNTNRPPDLTQPVDQTTSEGASTSLQLQASDPDRQDTLSFGAQGLPGGLGINPLTGLISGIVSCTAALNSPYFVTISVTDDSNPPLSDPKTFFWTVSAVNCEPVVTGPPNQTDSEGDTVSLQVTASDPDGSKVLTFGAQRLPPGLSINQNGLITGVLSYEANEGSPYTVTVTATDPGGMQGSASFQWIVQNTNRPPVLQAIPNQNNDEGEFVSLQVQATDPDQDSLQYSIQGQPSGVFIVAGEGLIQGKIACETAGIYQATVTVTDAALSDSQAFTWQVFQAECIPPEEFAFIPILLKQ